MVKSEDQELEICDLLIRLIERYLERLKLNQKKCEVNA